MWTDENRGRYDRSKLRNPSDLDRNYSKIRDCLHPIDSVSCTAGRSLPVETEHRLPVGVTAERPSGTQHGERLFLPLAV